MHRFEAHDAGAWADLDHGEGSIGFQWPDSYFGKEGLRVTLDGHCSRNMPIRSGDGPPEFVELRRDAIRIRFDAVLAAKLELPEEIEIGFCVSDEEFAELRRFVDGFNGETSS